MRRFLSSALFLFLAVGLAASAWAGPEVATPPVVIETIVPDVVGLDEAVAVRALEKVYVLQLEERPVRRRGAGTILAQEPAPGARLRVGGVLRLAVGRARPAQLHVPLPDVRHMALDEAEGTLLDLGLVPVPTFVRTRGRGDGRVRRQDPAPGTDVAHGSRVALEVRLDRGPQRRVRVPSLYGLAPTEAARALEALGLAARAERLPSRFDSDTIIRQNPRAGTLATSGSAVRLVVAVPAARTHVPARVQVPQLEGLTLAKAFASARRSGIQLVVAPRAARRAGAQGVILAQRPNAHVAVPLGTRVHVEVPAGVVVPDLVGQAPDAAVMRLWEAGLRLELEGGPVFQRGLVVVRQMPAAGTVVSADTTVHVAVARDAGPTPSFFVVVPNLKGRSLLDAHRLLVERGLSGVASTVRGPGPKGVTGQEPASGTRVRRGVKVRFTVRR